jgi:hypothetical protein
MRCGFVLIVLLAALSVPGFAVVEELSSLGRLTTILRDDDDLYLMLFHDSLDLNSIRLLRTFDDACAEIEGFVSCVRLDVRRRGFSWLLSSWNVQIIPSIKFLPHTKTFRGGGPHVGGLKTPIDYDLPLYNAESIRKFAMNGVPSSSGLVEKMTDAKLSTLQAAIKEPSKTITILFTDKQQTPVLFRRLALQFFQRINFLEVHGPRCPKTCKAMNVSAFPKLLVVPNASMGSTPIAYEGALEVRALSAFLDRFCESREDRRRAVALHETKVIQAAEKRRQEDVFHVATSEEWSEALQQRSIIAVLFSDPSSPDVHAENLKVLSAAKKSVGRSVVSTWLWIDLKKNEAIVTALSSSSISTNLVFIHPQKGMFTRFVGSFSVSGITSFIGKALRSGDGAIKLPVALPDFVER